MARIGTAQWKNVFLKNLRETHTRLLVIMLIPLALIILIVGISSYYISKDILKQELNEPQKQILKINRNYIDEYLYDANKISVQLALDNNVHRFLQGESGISFYENIREIYEKLNMISQHASYINSIYIYHMKEDSFVSIPQGYSSSSLTFNDAEWIDVMNDLEEQDMIVQTRDLPDGAKYKGTTLTLFRGIKAGGEMLGIIAINLDKKVLFSKLSSDDESISNSMQIITDPYNEIVYESSNHPFNRETIDYALEQVNAEKLDHIELNNEILLANQMESDLVGWKYISIVSQNSILAKAKTIRNVIFIVSILALIIGSVFIYVIHKKELKPIRRIKSLLSVDKNVSYQRELVYLEKIIDDHLHDYGRLSRLTEKVKIEVRDRLIHDIYEGKLLNQEELDHKWKTYFDSWNKGIQIAILSIDNYPAWRKNITPSYRTIVKSGIINIVNEVLATHFHVEAVDIGNAKIIFLINEHEEEVSLINHLQIATSNVTKIFGFTVSVGINQKPLPAMKLKHAIEEAESCLDQRMLQGYGRVYAYNEDTEEVKDDRGIAKIVQTVPVNTPAQTMQILDHVTEQIKHSTLSSDQLLSFMDQLRKNIFAENGWSQENKTEISIDDLATMTLDDIIGLFKEELSYQMEKIQRLSDSKRYTICKEMITYMEQNIGEPIGIPEIAEAVDVSVSLASQWFKEEMNDTIYGYFTRLRMERAKDLLIQTEEKIADVALEVGYQHENSFIRKFREYYEMTPGKYRKFYTVKSCKELGSQGEGEHGS